MNLRRHLKTRTVSILALAGLVAVVAAIGGLQAGWFSGSNPGRPEPGAASPQSSAATSSGVRVALTGAQFTGLETLARLELSAPDGSVDLAAVRSIAVLREDALGGLAPRGAGVSGPATKGAIPVIMPFAPVVPGEPASLHLSAITLSLADGSARRIEGSWDLKVTQPADIAELLKTTTLSSAEAEATASGITIHFEKAILTSADAHVTVSFEGASTGDILTPPLLRSTGRVYNGVLMPGADPAVGTWAFPREAFNAAATLEFRSILVRTGAKPVGGSTIDLHGVIADLGHAPGKGDTAAIGPARILSSEGTPPSQIRWTSGTNQAAVVVELVIQSASDPARLTPPDLLLPSGKTAITLGRIVGFNRDSSGTIIGGTTVYRYGVTSPSDVDGTVILDPGPGVSVARGLWKFDLSPASP
ncbi:MAG: hypothetical protein IT301_12375 [Dehalococcoidia bacterium]|nr:hypothetical protein [Dehalococcoidia bacterium]